MKNILRKLGILIFLILLLGGHSSHASYVLPMSIEEMVEEADLIVKGRVELIASERKEKKTIRPDKFSLLSFFKETLFLTSLDSSFFQEPIYSKIHITPLEIFKTTKNISFPIEVRQLGGQNAEWVLKIDNNPDFRYNEVALLFLAQENDGYYRVLNLENGKFSLHMLNNSIYATTHITKLKTETALFDYEELKDYILCREQQNCTNKKPPIAKSSDEHFMAFTVNEDNYTFMNPPYRYKSEYFPLPYGIEQKGDPTNDGSAISGLQKSFERWEEVSGISFRYIGEEIYTSSIDKFTNDHRIRVVLNDPFDDIPNEQKIIAIGGSYYSTKKDTAGKGFHEALNGFLIFNDSPIARQYVADPKNFEKIATHEIGHIIGIGHSSNNNAIMYAYGSVGDIVHDVNLHEIDIKAVNALYSSENKTQESIYKYTDHEITEKKAVQLTPESVSFSLDVNNNEQERYKVHSISSYNAAWVSQIQGDNGPNTAIIIKRGQQRELWAKFKNTGTVPWFNNGPNMIAFYIYKDPHSTPSEYNDPQSPLFGKSLFSGPTWGTSFDGTVTSVRATILQQSTVYPGEIGEFRFIFTAPQHAEATTYREDLTLAVGAEWMPNTINGDSFKRAHIWFPIKVE